jgi:hypothetical protein
VIYMSQTSTILTKAFVTFVLDIAQHYLETDGYLGTVLFLKPERGAPLMYTPQLATDIERRQRLFARLGASLHRSGLRAVEAVLLMESWFVQPKQALAGLTVRPSQHPDRQEAIVLVGRNAGNTRASRVIQPFHRGPEKRLVWEKRPVVVYNQPVEKAGRAEGLLDYLFAAQEGR